MKLVLLIQAGVTLFLTGVIWFVQVVHYPLMGRVGPERFAEYERAHSRLTSWVVMGPMMAELAIAVWIVWSEPLYVSRVQTTTGLALVVIIWLSTFLLQVPQHEILGRGFNATAHQRLARTNWVRTAAWTSRSILVLWMLR